jgi:hypothetical protein
MRWNGCTSRVSEGVGGMCDDAGITAEGKGDIVLAVGVKALWKV